MPEIEWIRWLNDWASCLCVGQTWPYWPYFFLAYYSYYRSCLQELENQLSKKLLVSLSAILFKRISSILRHFLRVPFPPPSPSPFPLFRFRFAFFLSRAHFPRSLIELVSGSLSLPPRKPEQRSTICLKHQKTWCQRPLGECLPRERWALSVYSILHGLFSWWLLLFFILQMHSVSRPPIIMPPAQTIQFSSNLFKPIRILYLYGVCCTVLYLHRRKGGLGREVGVGNKHKYAWNVWTLDKHIHTGSLLFFWG